MVNDADRVERENQFAAADHPLNVLVCSPFLELIREAGFPVPSHNHYPLPPDGHPIAEIDYRVGPAHVLVDGSVHHQAWVQQIDEAKRQALADLGYQVVVVDVDAPRAGLDRLRRLV